jgi:hypothetical protein
MQGWIKYGVLVPVAIKDATVYSGLENITVTVSCFSLETNFFPSSDIHEVNISETQRSG